MTTPATDVEIERYDKNYNDYLLQHLLTIDYKRYEIILEQCLPLYIPRELETQPPPLKKIKKDDKDKKFLTVFKGVIYSTVGSTICDGKQEVFIKNIINSLLNEKSNEKYVASILYAVALFQLSEDVNVMANSTGLLRRPTLGFWLDDILKYFDQDIIECFHEIDNKWSSIVEDMIAEQRQDLADFAKKMTCKLVSVCFNNKVKNYDEIMRDSKFTYSQIGMLLLCEIAGIDNMKRWLSKSSYYSNFQCGDILPFSKMFVPMETEKIRNWHRYYDSSLENAPLVIKNMGYPNIAEDDASNGYILLRLFYSDRLKTWAVSSMITTCYNIVGQRCGGFRETYYKEHVLDVQLVVVGRFVCVQIHGENVDLCDLEDAIYLEQANEVGFQFIAITMGLYKRMLLYLNPYYDLPNNYAYNENSYFMFISRENNEHSQLFFYAHLPKQHRIDCQDYDAEEREQYRLDRINDINNYISKFIILKKWYDRAGGIGYDMDQLESLFQIGKFLNDEEVISSGAKFIGKVIGDKNQNSEAEFIRYTQTEKEAMDVFDSLFKKCKIF